MKTKCMVVRAGPRHKPLSLTLNGVPVEEVSVFGYLGTDHSYTGKWAAAKSRAAQQGRKALFVLEQRFAKWSFNFSEKQEFFDKLLTPVLLYGSELWGCSGMDVVAKVHRDFVRRELGLRKSTPAYMITMEGGGVPLEVQATCRAVSFWAKLVDETIPSSLSARIYRLSVQDQVGSWYTEIRDNLCKYGFESVWQINVVSKRSRFVNDFKVACRLQYLTEVFQICFTSTKGDVYTLLSQGLEACRPAWHLSHLEGELAAVLSRFRTSNHRLPIELGRWNGTARDQRLCPNCSTLGDEFHLLIDCPVFSDLREPIDGILNAYRHLPRNTAVADILDIRDFVQCRRIARFLMKAEIRLRQDNCYELDASSERDGEG